MKTISRFTTIGIVGIATLMQAPLVLAQDPNAPPPENPNGGWRRLGDQDRPQPYEPSNVAPPPDFAQRRDPNGPPPDYRQAPPDYRQGPNDPNQRYSTQGSPNQGPPQYRNDVPPGRPAAPPPPQLVIAPGTFFTVRVNQPLSSDHNQPGDAFTAQLVKPIVVDGVIVADRGQTIAGRVAEVDKGGRVKGTSRLGIELTELTLIDGQQVTLRSQLINHAAPDSVGRDAMAIGTTTGFGALIGAAAAGGEGAAIGAGAGAAASVIGVLLTKGHPTIIYPESVLTFRMEAPITINTTHAPQAFRQVEQGDYYQPDDRPRLQTRAPGYGPAYNSAPYYGGGWYGPGWGYGYPGYFGPAVGVGVVVGPRYYGGYRGYYGGGFRGYRGGGGFRGGRR